MDRDLTYSAIDIGSNAVRLLTLGKGATIANPIRLEAVLACEELELPSPDLMLEGEGAAISTRTV